MGKGDIGLKDKPEGCGAINKSTLFIDRNNREIHRIKGDIIQSFGGKTIMRSRPGEPVVIKLQGQAFAIHDLIDRSENYNVTREIILREPTAEELQGNTADVTV